MSKMINGYFEADNMLKSMCEQFQEACGGKKDGYAIVATDQYRSFLIKYLVKEYLNRNGIRLKNLEPSERDRIINDSLCEIVNEYRADIRGVDDLQMMHECYLLGGEAILKAMRHL